MNKATENSDTVTKQWRTPEEKYPIVVSEKWGQKAETQHQ